MIAGIREYIYYRTSQGKLARGRYEVGFFEAAGAQGFED